MKTVNVRSKALIRLLGVAAFAMASGAVMANQFPSTGETETEPSYGAFKLLLNQTASSNPSIPSLLSGLGFIQNAHNPNAWTSPNLYDPSTVVGLSASTTQTAFFGGQSVVVPGVANPVTISSYTNIPTSFVPPNPTQGDGNMVVTSMESLDMSTTGVQVLAGSATDSALNIPESFGMVQSTAATDFPAQSFFDIFVEIKLTSGGNTYQLTTDDPLVVANSPYSPITSLPPNNLYAHGASQNAVQVYLQSANGPVDIGVIELAQHAIGPVAVSYYQSLPGGLQGSVDAGAVPEPSTWSMLLLGFAGLGFAGYRRSLKAAAVA
jgi:hypothetical protein